MSITSLRATAAVLAALALAASVPPAHAAGSGHHATHHSRPCFIVPAHWNVALDGPLPRC